MLILHQTTVSLLTTLSVLAKKEQEKFGVRCFDKADPSHDIPRVTHSISIYYRTHKSISILENEHTRTHTHISS